MNKKNSNTTIEIANEYNNNNLNQQAMDTLVATKAGGLITKKLVELGEKQLMQQNNQTK